MRLIPIAGADVALGLIGAYAYPMIETRIK